MISCLSSFLSALVLTVLALEDSLAVTGLGPSEPRDEAGDSDGTGLPGGGGGMSAVELEGGAEGDRPNLLVDLPFLVTWGTLLRPEKSVVLLLLLK